MSRSHPTRAVVFDLDGTLLNSLPLVLRAFSHALEPFGGKPTMEMFAHFGGPPEQIFQGLVADARDVPAALTRLHEFHRDHHHLIEPFPGAKAMLRELRSRGVTLAVWTGRDRASAEHLFRLHDLGVFFAEVVCGDDLPSHKPDPAGLREILRRLGLKSHEALYLGDADVDAQRTRRGLLPAGVEEFLTQRENHLGVAQHPVAGLGQRQGTSAAVKEFFPQHAFQCRNLRADGGLGDVQFVRRLAQAAFLGHDPEVSEVMVVQKFHASRVFALT